MRRILRIWPLYFVIVIIGYALLPAIAAFFHYPVPKLPPIGWFIFFGVNYYAGYVTEDFLFFLVFLWFVSVEEQFYLIWAIVMKYFKNHIHLICTGFVMIYLIFKYTGTCSSFYDTVNYLPDFAAGAFLAKSCFMPGKLFYFLEQRPRIQWGVFYFLFMLLIMFHEKIFANLHLDNFKHIILSVFFSLILFEQCFSKNALFSMGRYDWLNYLGRLNFGLYCWHGVVITVIKKGAELVDHKDSLMTVLLLYPLLTLIFTLLLAILSYHTFEKKFLKLKRYFSAIN